MGGASKRAFQSVIIRDTQQEQSWQEEHAIEARRCIEIDQNLGGRSGRP